MTKPLARKIPVAVLGATGAVGQTFVRLLDNHPWFELKEVAASERSAGKRYAEATKWIEGTMPEAVASLTVKGITPDEIGSPVVFSALDSSVAGDAELAFARAGRMVFSNAKNHRMPADVPLLIPEINAGHVSVLSMQKAARGWTGAVVTNSNCVAAVAAMALAPLHEAFTIENLIIATMQAVSGAGYPGVPSLDIIGNVIPFIADEEPKLEIEMQKILGHVGSKGIEHATFKVTSHTNRVPVLNGHTACMSVGFKTKCTPAEATEVLRTWKGCADAFPLPSRPEFPLLVTDQPNRPQPRRDVDAGHGMTVTVGRVREDNIFDLRLVAMGSNTIRGAAGGSILNAELLVARGDISAP